MHRSSDGNEVEEFLDIFVQHFQATVGDGFPNKFGVVGAMNAVHGFKAHPACAKGAAGIEQFMLDGVFADGGRGATFTDGDGVTANHLPSFEQVEGALTKGDEDF